MSKINVIQNLLDPKKYDLKCPWEYDFKKINHITVHNTANDASAKNEVAYMIRNENSSSFHIAVDDKEIVQGVSFDRGTFASGNREADVTGINLEICYSLSGGEKFINAEKLAAKYIAQFLKEKGWDISHVKKHQDFDGKYCPHRTLDLGWERFIKMIEEEMKEEKDLQKATIYGDLPKEEIEDLKLIFLEKGYDLIVLPKLKEIEEVAREVIEGKWGNGQERRNKLEQAGYDFSDVQNKVNSLL